MANIYKIVNLRIVSGCLSVQKAIAFLLDIFVTASGIAGMEKITQLYKLFMCENVQMQVSINMYPYK